MIGHSFWLFFFIQACTRARDNSHHFNCEWKRMKCIMKSVQFYSTLYLYWFTFLYASSIERYALYCVYYIVDFLQVHCINTHFLNICLRSVYGAFLLINAYDARNKLNRNESQNLQKKKNSKPTESESDAGVQTNLEKNSKRVLCVHIRQRTVFLNSWIISTKNRPYAQINRITIEFIMNLCRREYQREKVSRKMCVPVRERWSCCSYGEKGEKLSQHCAQLAT